MAQQPALFSHKDIMEISHLLETMLFKSTDEKYLDLVGELSKVLVVISKKYPTIYRMIMSCNDITTRKSVKNLFDMMASQIVSMMGKRILSPLRKNELICWFVLYKTFKLFLKGPEDGKHSIVQNS